MRILSEVTERLRVLFRRSAEEREMRDEIRFHVEMETDRLTREHRLAPEEAHRQAMIAFGGVERVKEEWRDIGRVNLLEDAWKDLRHGARGLRRSPGFGTVTVLVLALGIGAATAIFSIAYGVLFRSLPYEDPEQLVRLYWTDPTYEQRWTLSPPQFMSLRELTRTFGDIAVYVGASQPLTARGEARWLDGARVSAGFFEVMEAEPILGRTFVEGENLPGSDASVVISHAMGHSGFRTRSPVSTRGSTPAGPVSPLSRRSPDQPRDSRARRGAACQSPGAMGCLDAAPEPRRIRATQPRQ